MEHKAFEGSQELVLYVFLSFSLTINSVRRAENAHSQPRSAATVP